MVLAQQSLEGDESALPYLLQASSRIAKCMGAAFVPFLPRLLPSILVRPPPPTRILLGCCLLTNACGAWCYQGFAKLDPKLDMEQVGPAYGATG